MSRRPGDGGPTARAYLLSTLGLVLVGGWLAGLLGAPRGESIGGAVGAWSLQGASFAALVRALDAGESAVRAWLGGVAARFGGLVVAAVAAATTQAGPGLPLSYAAALVVLLFMEAIWLARRPWRPPIRTFETRREDSRSE